MASTLRTSEVSVSEKAKLFEKAAGELVKSVSPAVRYSTRLRDCELQLETTTKKCSTLEAEKHALTEELVYWKSLLTNSTESLSLPPKPSSDAQETINKLSNDLELAKKKISLLEAEASAERLTEQHQEIECLKSKLAEEQKNSSELHARINNLHTTQLEQSQEQISALSSSLQSAQTLITKLSDEVQTANSMILELKGEKELRDKTILEQTAKIDLLNKRVNEQVSGTPGMSALVADQQQQIASLEETIQNMKKTLTSEKDSSIELSKQLSSSQQHMNEVTSKLNKTEKKLSKAKERAEKLNQKLRTCEENLLSVTEKLRDTEVALHRSQEEKNSIGSEDNATKLKELQEMLSKAEEVRQQLEDQIKSLEKKLKEEREKRRAAVEQVGAMESKIGEIQSASEQEKELLKANAQELTEHLESQKKQYKKVKKELKDLKKRLQVYEEKERLTSTSATEETPAKLTRESRRHSRINPVPEPSRSLQDEHEQPTQQPTQQTAMPSTSPPPESLSASCTTTTSVTPEVSTPPPEEEIKEEDSLEAKAKQVESVTAEIVSSEDSYLKGIDTLINVFIKPMPEELVSMQARKTISSSIEPIKLYNTLFYKKLTAAVAADPKQPLLGPVFLEISNFLKVYTMYVQNYENAVAQVIELSKNPDFALWLENATKNPELKGLDIFAFLILPVQRIPRYVMLLQVLVKNSDPSRPDFKKLQEALDRMKTVATGINEKKREVESRFKVQQIEKMLQGKFIDPNPAHAQKSLTQPTRRWVHQGNVLIRGENSGDKAAAPRLLILFNDLLMATKVMSKSSVNLFASKSPCKALLSLLFGPSITSYLVGEQYKFMWASTLLTISVLETPEDNELTFHLNTNAKSLICQCSSSSSKAEWMNIISQAISEAHKLEVSLSERRHDVQNLAASSVGLTGTLAASVGHL
ncbi:Guanine exchange factor for Rac 30 [Pelomyxa schiedti]|nr:Guanine exchange factor for Rac 30 [Pelomyxa schiedti]